MIAYDMDGDASAWEKILRSDADVAFLRNPVEPPGYLIPYLSVSVIRLYDHSLEQAYQKRAAVLPLKEHLRGWYDRVNVASISENERAGYLCYIPDHVEEDIHDVPYRDSQRSMIVCSDVDLGLQNNGFALMHPQLYSLAEAPRLKFYVRSSRKWCAYEVVDVATGVQKDPQMVITSEWDPGKEDVMLLPVRDTRTAFLNWLKTNRVVYIAFGDGGTIRVRCSHVRTGVVPTYMGKPIMYWNGEYR